MKRSKNKLRNLMKEEENKSIMKSEVQIRTAIETLQHHLREAEEEQIGLNPKSEEYRAIQDSINQYGIEISAFKWIIEPGPEASPNSDLITIERLEKESGWENDGWGGFQKGAILVKMDGPTINVIIYTLSGYSKFCKGCSTMQDIKDLDRLVNG
jgi:hypothetical protein